jgi:hypothetical protein
MNDMAMASSEFYQEQIRGDSIDPYFAYRVYDQSSSGGACDLRLLRRATILLIESDPWFLATVSPPILRVLKTADLERLTPFVGSGSARKFAAVLRSILWYHGCRGPYHPDRAGRVQLRRALGFLQDVAREQRYHTWHEMLVGCYRALDYDKYKRAFAGLLAKTPPERCAAPLHDFLTFVAAKKDWRTYDRYRPRWEEHSAGRYMCECYINDVHTEDGLRAIAARDWNAVPDALAKAAAVRVCPHLQGRGLRLDLVRSLVSRKRLLGSVRTYLARASEFEASAKEAARLVQSLDVT